MLSISKIYVSRVSKSQKCGPGTTKSALLIIKKVDIAEQAHASLDVMELDSEKMRAELPFVFTNLYDGVELQTISSFILEWGILPERRPGKVDETA